MDAPQNRETNDLRVPEIKAGPLLGVSKKVEDLILLMNERHQESFDIKNHQLEAWDGLHKHRASGWSTGLLHMATGLGKTTVVAGDIYAFSEEFLANNGRIPKVLFMAHQTELLRQAEQRCSQIVPDLEQAALYMGKGTVDEVREADLVFATLQTMNQKKQHFAADHFDYVVVDESHHSMAPAFEKAIEYFKPAFRLGVTATPFRKDQKDITELFGKIVYSKNLAEAISDKLLDAPDYEVVADELLMKSIDLDFTLTKELRGALFDEERNRVIAKTIHRKQETMVNPRTIVFAQNILHAEDFTRYLDNAISLHSELSHEERRRILAAFRSGEIPTIVAVDMLNEGVDIPEANLAVFLRSTASRTIFEQQLGRILRKMSEKDAHVLDFVGTAERLRMIYDLSEEVRKINEEKAQTLELDLERGSLEYSRFGTFSPKFNHYSVDVIERIRLLTESEQLAPEGWMNVGQIADVVGRSTFYIYTLVQSLEVPTRKFRTPTNYSARYLSPENTKKIIELFENPEGYVSATDLMVILGKSNSYVTEYINDNEIETRQFVGESGVLMRHISPENAERIILEHMATEPPPGWVPISEVGREHSVNRLTVKRAIRRLGVEAVKYTSRVTNQLTLHVSQEDVVRIDDYFHPKGVEQLSSIAKRIGMSTQAVKNRALAMNFEIVEKMATRADGKPMPSDYVSLSDSEILTDYFGHRRVESPPDGWVKVAKLAAEFNLTYSAVSAMARKMGIVTEQYKLPEDSKRMTYVSADGAEKLRSYYS